MSGDASEGTATFNASNSNLTISEDSDSYSSAPFFFITNTKSEINLENNTLKYGSNLLLKIAGTSEWGKSGSNGGDVTLNATDQELEGDIEVDSISSLVLNLKENSTLKSAINTNNEAKNIELNIDSTSKLTLTGNTYVTTLNDEDTSYSNIDFNGYTLYVNGEAIN